MAQPGIPKKNLRLFRATQTVVALLFGGIAAWMFSKGYDFVMASLIAGAGLIALIDAIIGWRKIKD